MTRIEPNPVQQRAIEHTNGPSRIMAGAGTGKTQTLTERFVYLVEHGTPAHTILTVTFTAKAAAELRHRILNRLQSSIREIWIDTFHGLCRRLLNDWNGQEDRPPWVFLDEDEALHLILRAVAAFESGDRRFYRGEHASEPLAHDLKTVIDRTRDQLLTIDGVEQYASANNDERMLDLVAAFRIYDRFRKEQNALAYSDLVFDVVDRLEHDAALLQATRERFVQVMVDEFQDVNAGQFRLLQLLVPPDGNLCVVGDANQAIYAFRGGVSEYMQDFESYYPGASTYQLTTNYRSGQEILDYANRLIRFNEGDEAVELTADRGNPTSAVASFDLADEEYEAEWIARQIRSLLRDDTQSFAFSDIAILLRSVSRSSGAIQRALALNGIPYQVGKIAGGEYQVVQEILAALRIAIESPKWNDVARLVANRQCDPSLLRRIEVAIPNEEARDGLLEPDAELPARLPADAVAALDTLRRCVMHLRNLRNLPLPELFYQAMQATRHFNDEVPASTASFLSDLTRMATSLAEAGATPSEFLDQISLAWDTQVDQHPEDDEGVQIVTVHSAKGLEWKIVFVAGLAEGSFPTALRRDRDLDMDLVREFCRGNGTGSRISEEALATAYLAEERRLAYVAMTRARQHLVLTAPASIRNRAARISPFVSESSGDIVPNSVRGSRQQGPPVSISDIVARLHSARRQALETPVTDVEAATSFSHVLLAEWAADRIPGVTHMRDRRLPTPHTNETSLHFSFTQLETYANCPRQYFYARVLNVDVEEESTYLTLGSILHQALEKLNRQWRERGTPPSDHDIVSALSECWNEAEFALAGQQDQLHQRSIAMLRRLYNAEHQRETHRLPVAVEERIELDYGQHTLTGKIDLVLTDEAGNCELIDFKSGKARNFKTKATDSIQLFLYAHAWQQQRNMGMPKTSYYFMRHEDDRGFDCGESWEDKKQVKSHQFEEQTSAAMKERINSLLSGIVHNQFEATPSSDVCPRCPYRRICPDAM